MNPKPLVALNHFTVPLAITSSPRDQKQKRTAGPRKPACPMGARYAVWGALDSSNDTGILAENDHYRGAFAVFACFAIIYRPVVRKRRSVAVPQNQETLGRWAAEWLNLEPN